MFFARFADEHFHDEVVRLHFSDGKVVVNSISTTTEKEVGGLLPDEAFVICRLPQGTFQGSFKPKSWSTKTSITLTRTHIKISEDTWFKGEIGCIVSREWKGKGGNFSAFRLFSLDTPRFRARQNYIGKASNRDLSSFAPKITIRGGFAYFDARRYADGIDRAKDITVVCDLPNGQAFGLVHDAR